LPLRRGPELRGFTLTFPGSAFDEAKLGRLEAKRFRQKQHGRAFARGVGRYADGWKLLALLTSHYGGINTVLSFHEARKKQVLVGMKVAFRGWAEMNCSRGLSDFCRYGRLSRR